MKKKAAQSKVDHNSKDHVLAAWTHEYQQKGIPSSFRTDPTLALVEFIVWCKENGITKGKALDIGCGQGRNSIYLTHSGFDVIAFDLLEENADHINNIAAERNLPIQAYAHDASTPWAIRAGSLDLAVDIFCYKHIVDKKEQQKYRKELWKALKPGAHFFLSLASIEDGFYGPLLSQSENKKINLIVDPNSNIPSLLYTKESIVDEFSKSFSVVNVKESHSVSPMYGKEYPRVVLNCIFTKRS